MARTLALAVLGIGSLLILASFVSSTSASIWIFTVVTMSFPVCLIAIGVASRGGWRHLKWPLGALFLLLQASGAGLVASAGHLGGGLFGLPPGALFMLFGIWLAPLLLLSVTYPYTFPRVVLDRATLERIRALETHRG